MAFRGGPGLWADVGYRFEEAVRLCMTGVADPSPAVRDAFAMALGEMVAACRSEAAMEAVSAIAKAQRSSQREESLYSSRDVCIT